MRYPIGSRATALAIFVAITFVVLCIVGTVRMYTPVPLGDDWQGYLPFNLDVLDGKYVSWLTLFDEHPIVLPRVLYWLDFRFFRGTYVFLIAANFVLNAVICGVMALFIRARFERPFVLGLVALSCALVFSWIQVDNFQRGFYGAQWFMAMLFPLSAFYCLHASERRPVLYGVACLMGVASVLTMASGLVVIPVIAFVTILLKMSRTRIFASTALFATSVLFYRWQYIISTHESSITRTYNPLTISLFVLTYIGNPFFYVVMPWAAGISHVIGVLRGEKRLTDIGSSFDYGGGIFSPLHLGTAAALMAGILFAVLLSKVARDWFRNGRSDFWQAAILGFILIVCAGAGMTAIGRASFGFDFATQDRYTTGPILAWIAFGILLLARCRPKVKAAFVQIASVAILIALMPTEIRALKSHRAENEERAVAWRAVRAGAATKSQIEMIGRIDFIAPNLPRMRAVGR